MPVHIAIIMDGNGRWAKKRKLPRVAGHRAGVKTVDKIVEEATRLGIKVLTLYTFSTENWSRPQEEVSTLMDLLYKNLISKLDKLTRNGTRLTMSGDLSKFPDKLKKQLNETMEKTAGNDRLILNLALGYSGRGELINACRSLAEKVKTGELRSEDIDEDAISSHLYTAGLPDPDLMIRTSGECRLSNFLLWQCSYSEFYFTPVLWPDFSGGDLSEAIYEYQSRERRYGGVPDGKSSL